MSRRMSWLAGVATLILIAVAFNNCGPKMGFSASAGSTGFTSTSGSISTPLNSTISGNPVTPPHMTNAVTTIVTAVCGLMQQCYQQDGVTTSSCYATMTTSKSLNDNVLGLDDGEYSTFQSAIDAESDGSLVANQTAEDACMTDISNETCSTIKGSYDPKSANPYVNVSIAFPTSCKSVFGGTREDE